MLWAAFHSEALTYNILRGVWIACAGLFVCAAALLYLRIAATLIGGFGVPALFGILTLGFPDSVILGLQREQHCFSLPHPMCTGDEGVFLLAAAAAGGLALVAVAGLAAWLWPRSRVIVNAAIAGSVMLSTESSSLSKRFAHRGEPPNERTASDRCHRCSPFDLRPNLSGG